MNAMPDIHKLAAETLTGDVRDMLLTHIRAMETPWSKLSERDQELKISAAVKCADELVRRAVQVVAHKGFPHLIVGTGKWAVKEGIILEVKSSGTVENITKLAEHGVGAAILVLAEPSQFWGEKDKAKPEPDQPDLLDDELADDVLDEAERGDAE